MTRWRGPGPIDRRVRCALRGVAPDKGSPNYASRGSDTASTGTALANRAEREIPPLNSQSAASDTRVCARLIESTMDRARTDVKIGALRARRSRSAAGNRQMTPKARTAAYILPSRVIRSAPPDVGRRGCGRRRGGAQDPAAPRACDGQSAWSAWDGTPSGRADRIVWAVEAVGRVIPGMGTAWCKR